MLAALDKAKDNGLIVMITPSSVMDGVDSRIRKQLTKDAEFITAYRLPSDVFAKTGTDVITDVIFLRRRVRDSLDMEVQFENNTMFEETDLIGLKDLDMSSYEKKGWKKDTQIAINSYYLATPDNILGEKKPITNRFGQPIVRVEGELDNKVIGQMLNDGVEYKPSPFKATSQRPQKPIIYYDPKEDDITPSGGVFEKDGKWYKRIQERLGDHIIDKGEEMSFTKEEVPTIREMLKVAALSQTVRVQARTGNEGLSKLISDLKASVDKFMAKNAAQFKNKKLIEKISTDPRYWVVKELSSNPDIFKTDTLTVKEYKITLDDAKNLEILAKHLLNRDGKITVENVAATYQGGISKGAARDILEHSDNFFKMPLEREVEEFDALGNVTYKRVKDTEYSYNRKIDYLSGNIYKKIEAVKAEIQKGHAEFEKNLKALEKVLPEPKTLKNTALTIKAKWMDTDIVEKFLHDYLGADFQITYNNIKREYVVKTIGGWAFTEKYKSLKINNGYLHTWLDTYLNDKDLIVYKGGEKDPIATATATKAMRKIDEYFLNYLKATPEVAEPLMHQYNYISNNWVQKDYSKDKIIIPGANPDFKFRNNQLEFVNMAMTLGSAVNAQRTGAGKTATNAAVNQMLKVTGRANKPIAVVPGKVIKKFVRDIKEGSRGLASIFPNMKILDTTDYTFNEALAKIAFNNWDLILMPDTWFKRISMTPERESLYVQEQLRLLEVSEQYRATIRGSKRSQTDYEKRKEQLLARLAELRNYSKQDGLYFEDLGIDAISMDEAQSVKNLVTSVKGADLGMSATPSQVALDFNMKAKYVMEKKNGKNIFLYTATPVSNSMLEIYGLLQNIAPQEWLDRHIFTPDDFVSSVVDNSPTIGITTSNEVGTIKKVDGFINIDDLRGLFRKYVDYRPFIEGAVIPDVEETRYTVDMTDWQRRFFKDILDRLKAIKDKKPRELPSGNLDNIMTVLHDARSASVSPSMVTGVLPTLENSPKVAMAIDVAAKIYKETGKNQVIFLGDDYGEKMLGKNNLHNFIKKELVKAGIPEKEIVIVNGQINSKPEKKLEIQDAFNDGKYKVIIGTSDTIGAGMDLQENTVSMINIDIPWTPTDVTQRRGRGERPGNVNKLIGNINFFTRGSYDAWSANIVGIKKKWQDQLLEGSGDSENGYLQNQDNDNYDIDTIMAELMEDPVEKEQHNLLAERRLITGEITSLNESLKSVEKQIADVEGGISERETKIKGYQEELIKKPDGKLAPMQIEKLSKTIESLTSELSELGDKKDGIVSGIKLKEDELQAFEQSVAGRLQAAEAKRGKPTAVSKEKNDTGALVKKLRETNKVLPKPKEVPSQFQGEEPKSHGGIYVGNRNRKVTGNEFENPTIEARYKSSHGIAREAWYTKIIDGIKEFYHMSTRTFRELPENTPEFAEAIKEILRMENHGKLAASETIRILKDIRKNLTPEDFDMFNRYVLVKDLAEDVSNGLDLPLGFTPADVQKELVKLDNKLTPEVKTALKKRSDYWGKIRRDYIAAMRDIGIDMSKRFTKDDYFRHQVLEYMNEKNSNAVEYSGTEARPDLSRGHLKERKGYEGDINTDYLQAEYQVMSQMFHDIRLAKSLKVFIDNYDISAKVHEEARKVAESTGAIVDWHDFIPEGYATFQLRQGRAFFQTMGLAQKAIDELLAAIPESIEINVDDVRKILAVGQRYKEYVMKQELVDKLGRMLEIKKENIISKLNRKALNAFKAWVTGINPEYFVKFNIRNFTGDLDRVIMADPKILKYLPKALNDVTAAYIKNKFSPELLPYWDKGGFENMQLPQELGDVNKMFPELFGKENLKNPVKFVLRGINGFSNWRESLLRYAAYLYYLEKYQKGEQVYYGPAKYNMIAGLKTNEDKAFEMQNYAVGAYNRVSETGKFISKYLIPFFRFMEHNFRAYVNAEINSVRPSIIKEQLNAKGKKVNAGNKIFQGSKNFTRQNVLALALTAIIFAWNQLRYPDEDEDLPDNAKEQPHVNLGYDKDGKPVYFTRVGTLGDFLEWFKDPLNKVASGFNPLYKTPAELVAGRSVFPDVRNPSTIRDKKLYGFKALGVEDVGRKILGLPENKTGTKGLPNLFIYKSDPEATAYQKTLDLKAQFETDTLGKSQTAAYNQSPKSNALYNYKLALKYEDGAAAEKFLQKYYDLGGTAKGLKTSLSSLDPLYGLSQDEQWQFYGSLTDKQFKDLQKAIDYYNDLLRR
ncbi:MAG: helicase-related protein [Bacillota bacterium]|nr:helicase-related protein [Bacillota bacterium]